MKVIKKQRLQESDFTGLDISKDYKTLSGIFAETDTLNENGRVYPESVYIPAYNNLSSKVEDRTVLGELDHPADYDEVRLSNVSHVITETHVEDVNGHKVIKGTVELLDTPAGLIAQALVKAGIPLGISSRGLGDTRMTDGHEEVTDFDLITYDLVANPSFSAAVLSSEASEELDDAFRYVESRLYTQHEKASVGRTLTKLRESYLPVTTKSRVLSEHKSTNRVDVKSLQETVNKDTKLLKESRAIIKKLRAQLDDTNSRLKSTTKRLHDLQEEYNVLVEKSKSEVCKLEESLLSAKKTLAAEKRGISYSRVSNLLEGAQTEEDIEERLNSLGSSSFRRKVTTDDMIDEIKSSRINVPITESEGRMSRLAKIIARK